LVTEAAAQFFHPETVSHIDSHQHSQAGDSCP
jgi:hypothetical protein